MFSRFSVLVPTQISQTSTVIALLTLRQLRPESGIPRSETHMYR
jgi:hypothetical protein